MPLPSLFALSELRVVDRVGRYAFLFHELFNLRYDEQWLVSSSVGMEHVYTRSNVFFAFSETKGSAMGGIESDAGIVVAGWVRRFDLSQEICEEC